MRRQKIQSDRMKQHQKIPHQKKFKKFNMLKHKPKQQNIQTANDTERKDHLTMTNQLMTKF